MIPARPVQKPNERTLAYYHRVSEWERLVKPLMQAECRAIDTWATKAPAIHANKHVTRQTERDRLSIHDHAQNNPVLLRILKRMR